MVPNWRSKPLKELRLAMGMGELKGDLHPARVALSGNNGRNPGPQSMA
jgi:hypothetical protein